MLANESYETFYGGQIGRQITDELQKLGSKMTIQDLSDYRYVTSSKFDIIYHQQNRMSEFSYF